MPSAPYIFDILIIGAGPTGAAAAVTARHAGLSAAIIDKAKFPRNKLCGELISGRSAALCRQIFDQALEPEMFEPRSRITFHADGAPLGDEASSPPIYPTMRRDMDAHLLEIARAAGAAVFTGRRIGDLDTGGITVSLEDGSTLAGRIMIGADDVNSMIARALFGRAFNLGKIGFALEVEAPALPASQRDTIRIDLGAAGWGYGWHFPKACSTTIGIGGINAENTDMKARLSAYRAVLAMIAARTLKATPCPLGTTAACPARGACC